MKLHPGFNVPKEFEDLYDINNIPDIPQPPCHKEPDTHLVAYDADPQSGIRYLEWRKAWEKMTPLERRRTTLRYYANCSWLYAYFCQVLDKLKKMGRLDNALIVFTSDHREMLSERDIHFSKYCLFDSSVRVPLILAGSVISEKKRGTIDDRPVELIDLVPAFVHVAGQLVNSFLPGLDLLDEPRHMGSFSEFHGRVSEPYRLAPAYMWRKKDWKFILFIPGRMDGTVGQSGLVKGELYNLEDDPHEWKNLYDNEKSAAVREQWKNELTMYLACVWARSPLLSEEPRERIIQRMAPNK